MEDPHFGPSGLASLPNPPMEGLCSENWKNESARIDLKLYRGNHYVPCTPPKLVGEHGRGVEEGWQLGEYEGTGGMGEACMEGSIHGMRFYTFIGSTSTAG